MFDLKPDYEDSKRRIEAFWEREIIDRPVVQFSLARPIEEWVPLPPSSHATLRDRWLDADYQARYALANLSNHEFLGDTLPVAFPNLGPELFAAFYGCPLHFGDSTSWTDPILHDWAEADQRTVRRFKPLSGQAAGDDGCVPGDRSWQIHHRHD